MSTHTDPFPAPSPCMHTHVQTQPEYRKGAPRIVMPSLALPIAEPSRPHCLIWEPQRYAPAAVPVAGAYTWNPRPQAGIYPRPGLKRVGPHPVRPPAHCSPTVMSRGPLLCARHCARFLESLFTSPQIGTGCWLFQFYRQGNSTER